jgi:hypothetical protein
MQWIVNPHGRKNLDISIDGDDHGNADKVNCDNNNDDDDDNNNNNNNNNINMIILK